MRTPHVLLAVLASGLVISARAHAQHGHGAPVPTQQTRDDTVHGEAAAPRSQGPATSRDGSGTGWLPKSSPVHAIHLRTGDVRWMFHGNLNAGVNWQDTDRGDEELISTNWMMAMASLDVAGSELMGRAMLSLEPLTVGDDGYALLAQTGEAFEGEPLVDKQHPHDLFMEVAAQYRRPIAGGVGIEIYGGPAGEPALGPVAFPHRPSAMQAPLAPLGHHWLDSSHITFGVVTAGITTDWAKLEGSWFNGREPDEERYDFDLRGFDSYAARLQIAPHRDVSAQVSWGFLESPEELQPDVSLQRVTASAVYNRSLGGDGNWATTAAWGRNMPDGAPDTDALLLESAVDTGRFGIPYARVEQVDKLGHDFGLEGPMEEATLRVHAASVGYVYELPALAELNPGIGVVGGLTHLVDDALADLYGESTLFAAMGYVTLRPARARSMHGMH
jgi:hypothetical protein